MIQIASIPITQDGVRDIDQVTYMIRFVQAGGVFDDKTLTAFHSGSWAKNRISIACMEDGTQYFHDGHHRLLAIWMAGRKVLYDDEVEYFDLTYAQYDEVNFETGWLTPFDLKTEIRTPNVHEFKQKAKAMPRENAEEWVRSNKGLYCHPRNGMYNIEDLAIKIFP